MWAWWRRAAAAVTAVMLTGCGSTAAVPVSSPPPASEAFAFQPLWPFAAQHEADDWLNDGAPAGHSPWHADAKATALFFTQNYLGFAEIDQATTVDEQAREAWIGVGYSIPEVNSATAATIHLARFGPRPEAPWEVVGTRDAVLTLDAPPYGSTVGPVIDAGGTITGVDESLHLQVRQLTQPEVLGEDCCLPAGGQARPWSARVTMTTPPQPGALTLVVSTGGHVANVERFAVTGLRAQ
ncbi:hypothetical protein FR943_02235 [Mycobacterium sp. TNTM28]|uniref:Uncharacterized protein n=1 Tax=[Mycobacterium] fortunisiensis TaxID=2600579 RepID=A0ABS6KGI4_9MYCO|nr:hypothetical protein [[Mycobacterium] fortunisiensis]MBU9762672.1 hypothetical protein [[Mycobacterium] fortunisiensis]